MRISAIFQPEPTPEAQADGEDRGYELHGCALATRELGGTLTAHSDGPDHGARFIIELPSRSEALTSS